MIWLAGVLAAALAAAVAAIAWRLKVDDGRVGRLLELEGQVARTRSDLALSEYARGVAQGEFEKAAAALKEQAARHRAQLEDRDAQLAGLVASAVKGATPEALVELANDLLTPGRT